MIVEKKNWPTNLLMYVVDRELCLQSPSWGTCPAVSRQPPGTKFSGSVTAAERTWP